MSVLITVVPAAKVLASDMLNLALRPGSPNPLKVTVEGDRLPASSKQKKPPGPPDAHRVLTELPSDTRGQKLEPLVTDSNPVDDRSQPMVVAVHISAESDFTTDLHQIIPSEPQYSPPLQPTDTGGVEMWYDGAAMITNFDGIYYFESGILQPSYTNPMPYNHPLD